jgi:tRNA acetyltransferase TAN1
MKRGNILITFHQNAKVLAEEEARRNLKEVGASVEWVEQSDVEGVFEALVIGDPKRTVADIRTLCLGQPELFQNTHHWVPIDRWVPSEEKDMVKATKEIGKGISVGERWMMHLHKRHLRAHTTDLLMILTEPIDVGTVDLEDPDKVVVVEILGERAGMALVRKDELLDVNKVREAQGIERV